MMLNQRHVREDIEGGLQAQSTDAVSSAEFERATLRELSARYQEERAPLPFAFRKAVRLERSADRATHNLHPYPGKMLPQVAAFLIRGLTIPGDLILDPFGGSGTVALEAALVNRRCISRDQNPFACLLSQVKVTPLDAEATERAILQVPALFKKCRKLRRAQIFWQTDEWYPPSHLGDIRRLRQALDILATGCPSEVARFLDIAFLATARSVSLADPAFPVPVRLSATRRLSPAAARHLRKLAEGSVIDRFVEAALLNLRRVTEYKRLLLGRAPEVAVVLGDSRQTRSRMAAELADLILTSPPYPGAQKYIRASFPALEWLGLVDTCGTLRKLQVSSVGRERYHSWHGDSASKLATEVVNAVRRVNAHRAQMLHTYFVEFYKCLRRMMMEVKPRGTIALVVSPNRVAGISVPTPAIVSELAAALGWRTDLELVDELLNGAQPTKRHSSAGPRIATEHVIILAR